MQTQNRHFFLSSWLPVVIWMAVIFILSTDFGAASHTSQIIEPLVRWLKPDITLEQLGRIQFFIRKTAHLTEYAILGVLLVRALGRSFHALKQRASLLACIALLAASAYASSDEYHQSFSSARTGCIQDVLIDSAGALAGVTIASLVIFSKTRSRQKAPVATAPQWAAD